MHERIIGLYEDKAAAWDRDRGGDLIEKAWLDRFCDLVPALGSVLDLGCGSGQPIGRYLIGRGLAVTGVDSSAALIALCRERFPGQEWCVADMRALDLGRRFEGIIAWHSFFHLPPQDQRRMFDRFAAHSRSGGVLMFTSGSEAGETLGEWQGEPLYHASLDPDEYETLLRTSGFSLIERRVSDPGCGDATVWLARRQE